MKRIAVLTIVLCGLSGAAAVAEVEFSVAPTTRKGFGDTRFELLIVGYDVDSTLVSGGSELVFPLDYVHAGIQFGMSVIEKGHRAWTTDLSLSLAANDPSSKMIDDDWDNVGPVELLWSHTLSQVDGSAWEASLEVTRLVTAAPDVELSILAGVTLQKFKQRMVDLQGWQYLDLDSNGQLESYVWKDNDLAGTYEVRYVRPKLGLVSRLQAGQFHTEIQASLSPLLYVKDIDDHVRRGFQITTDGKGLGAGARLSVRYEHPTRGASTPFIALSGDYFRAEIDVVGTRNYYVDVEEYGISRGDRFAESHLISTTQYGLQLAAGVAF